MSSFSTALPWPRTFTTLKPDFAETALSWVSLSLLYTTKEQQNPRQTKNNIGFHITIPWAYMMNPWPKSRKPIYKWAMVPSIFHIANCECREGITCSSCQLIGLRDKLQEHPMIFMGKSGWFPVKIFPFWSTHWSCWKPQSYTIATSCGWMWKPTHQWIWGWFTILWRAGRWTTYRWCSHSKPPYSARGLASHVWCHQRVIFRRCFPYMFSMDIPVLMAIFNRYVSYFQASKDLSESYVNYFL